MSRTEEIVRDLLSKGYERNFIYQEMVKKGYNSQEVLNLLNIKEKHKNPFPIIALGIILFSIAAFFFAQMIMPDSDTASDDGKLILNLDFEKPDNMHEDTTNLINIYGHSENDCYMEIDYTITDSFGDKKANVKLNERVMIQIPILLKEKIPVLEEGLYQIKITATCQDSRVNLGGKFRIKKAIETDDRKEDTQESNREQQEIIEPEEKTQISDTLNCSNYESEEECVITVAEKNNDENICTILTETSSRDSCYANLALSKGIELCNHIEDEYIKFGCIKITGELKK